MKPPPVEVQLCPYCAKSARYATLWRIQPDYNRCDACGRKWKDREGITYVLQKEETLVDRVAQKTADSLSVSPLHAIWTDQETFNAKVWYRKDFSDAEKGQWTKDMAIYACSEIWELLQEVSYKIHAPTTKRSPTNLDIELIDIFKYWLSLSIMWGLTPERLVESYWEKSRVVEHRWKQKNAKIPHGSKVVGVDIDGVLADLVKMSAQAANRMYAPKVYDHRIMNSAMIQRSFADQGMSVQQYEDLTVYLKESGKYRELEPIEGAIKFVQELRRLGYYIIVLSSRSVDTHKRLLSDTLYWLDKNEIPYDYTIFDRQKHRKLAELLSGVPPAAFVDDDVDQLTEIAWLGAKGYWRNFSNPSTPNGVTVFTDFNEILIELSSVAE